MAIDGCEINLQVINEIYRCIQGLISHKEMIENIVSEWKRQSDSKRASKEIVK